MMFNAGAALLDTIVLSVIERKAEGIYGYKMIQDIRLVLDVSEATLYLTLHRLQRDDCLQFYDEKQKGRNRKYYQITEIGKRQVRIYKKEWYMYVDKITMVIGKG